VTHATHVGLERALDLLNPAIKLADYRALLARFYGYYLPLESAMSVALAGSKPELAAGRWKCAALAEDLRALGMSATALEQLPSAKRTPTLSCVAEVIGAMYVTEGSTLGGAVLTRHFSDRFGLTREHGLAFFNVYGVRTGDLWQRYLSYLPAFDNPSDAELVVSAAMSTFESLAAWLTRQPETLAVSHRYA
jgi:heme oxygenase